MVCVEHRNHDSQKPGEVEGLCKHRSKFPVDYASDVIMMAEHDGMAPSHHEQKHNIEYVCRVPKLKPYRIDDYRALCLFTALLADPSPSPLKSKT